MFSIFKTQQPISIFAFFLFFIVIKIPFIFLTNIPIAPLQNLWDLKFNCSTGYLLNFLIAQVCLLVQALWLNYLFHKADYHESNSMFPAVFFALLSAVLPTFNVLSVYLLMNFILLLLMQTFLSITTTENAKVECYNVGFLGGILLLLNINYIPFILCLFLMLYAVKSFRINDYFLLLFGILTPIYLGLGISYVAEISLNADIFSWSNFYFLRIHYDILNCISLITVVVFLLFSFISLRGILFSVGFKRRKNFNMLVYFLIGIVLSVLWSGSLDETTFSLLFIPASIFLALFMLRIRKRKLGEVLSVIFVVTIFIVNIVRIFK